jgi:HAD superfamily hydrolase (TIGR01509 family)
VSRAPAIRAVLWDNDGVLVESEPLYFQATRELLDRAGIALSREAFIEISLRQGRSCFALAEQAGLALERIEALRLERDRRYAELLAAGVVVRPGVGECLARLAGRVRMAVVTSSSPDHFALIHARTSFRPFFEFVLTGEDTPRHKPHPDPYLLAAARLGLEPAECLAIEDTERGLQSAVAAGMRCAVIPHDLTLGGDFAAAWQVLEHARLVPGLVEPLLDRGAS